MFSRKSKKQQFNFNALRAEIDDLKDQLNNKNNIITNITIEKNKMKTKLYEYEDLEDNYTIEYNKLKEINDILTVKKNNFKNKNNDLSKEIQNIQNKNNQLSQEVKNIQNKNNQLSRKNQELETNNQNIIEKYNKSKIKYNKLISDNNKIKNTLIITPKYYYKNVKLVDFLNTDIYGGQRVVDPRRIDDIIFFQKNYMLKYGYYQFSTPFLVAIHPDGKENFVKLSDSNKKLSNEVLFDGQHRFFAFKKMFEEKENDDLNNVMVDVKYVYCNNDKDVFDEFLNVNKCKPVIIKDHRPEKIIDTFYNMISEKYNNKFLKYCTNTKQHNYNKFHLFEFKNFLSNDIQLSDIIVKFKLQPSDLMKNFQEINDSKIKELKYKTNTQIRREIKTTNNALDKSRENIIQYPDDVLVLQVFYNDTKCKKYQQLINEMISSYLPDDDLEEKYFTDSDSE